MLCNLKIKKKVKSTWKHYWKFFTYIEWNQSLCDVSFVLRYNFHKYIFCCFSFNLEYMITFPTTTSVNWSAKIKNNISSLYCNSLIELFAVKQTTASRVNRTNDPLTNRIAGKFLVYQILIYYLIFFIFLVRCVFCRLCFYLK